MAFPRNLPPGFLSSTSLGRSRWRLGSGKGGEGGYGFPFCLLGVVWGFFSFSKFLITFYLLFVCGCAETQESGDNSWDVVLSSATWVLAHVWRPGEGIGCSVRSPSLPLRHSLYLNPGSSLANWKPESPMVFLLLCPLRGSVPGTSVTLCDNTLMVVQQRL